MSSSLSIREKQDKENKVILILIIIFCTLFSLFILTKFRNNEDDEVAYVAASGNYRELMDVFQGREYPYGEIANKKLILDFLRVKEKFCFGKIAQDLSEFCMHPPLFFWLLHIWLLITGGQGMIYTGPLLNLFLVMFIIFVLFRFAKYVFNSIEDALFVVLIFILNPALYLTALESRMYIFTTLLSLIATFYLYKLLSSKHRLGIVECLIFSFLICLGLLCRYSFILLCIGWLIYGLVNYWKTKRIVIVWLLLSVFIGILFFLVIFPQVVGTFNFYKSIDLQQRILDIQAMNRLGLDDLVAMILNRTSAFIFSAHQSNLIGHLLSGQMFFYITIILLAFLMLGFWFVCKKKKASLLIFFTLFWPWFFMSLAYVMGRISPWLLHIKYYFFLLPLFCLIIVLVVKERFLVYKRILLICLCQILFFSTVDNLISKNYLKTQVLKKATAFKGFLQEFNDICGKSLVVSESMFISNMFKISHLLPEDTKVLMADPFFFVNNYSDYFGEKSDLFPFVYISYFIRFSERNRFDYLFIERLANDKNVHLKLVPVFFDPGGQKGAVFLVHRDQDVPCVKYFY